MTEDLRGLEWGSQKARRGRSLMQVGTSGLRWNGRQIGRRGLPSPRTDRQEGPARRALDGFELPCGAAGTGRVSLRLSTPPPGYGS